MKKFMKQNNKAFTLMMQAKKVLACSLTMVLLGASASYLPSTPITTVVEAHSGRTDRYGGHHDYQNKSGLGSYHYHCGGYPAHLHKNGVCPYTSSYTNYYGNNSSKSDSLSSSTIKKVQQALNKRGYSCGTADGIMGKRTRIALKKFQKANGLTVDGKIGPQVKKALNI